MPRLLISSYAAIADTIRRHRPSHMLTLMDEHVETPPAIPPERHFRIQVNDIVEPAEGAIAPSAGHIEDVLTFARTWRSRSAVPRPLLGGDQPLDSGGLYPAVRHPRAGT